MPESERAIAVLASGAGTILSAIVEYGLPVAAVLLDRACPAEEVALGAGVPVLRVPRESFGPSFDRGAYTRQVVEALDPYELAALAMAGFMTVLSGEVHDAYPGRILNTHPSLLPAFKGAHAVEEALAAGVAETGCTVHVAAVELDSGPVLASRRVPVLPGDTAEKLHERIKEVERVLYPETIKGFIGSPRDGSPRCRR